MSVVLNGWFDGLAPGALEEAVVGCLRRAEGFVIEPWGVVVMDGRNRELVLRLELGDRVIDETARQNRGEKADRLDRVVGMALRTQPLSFMEFLAQAG